MSQRVASRCRSIPGLWGVVALIGTTGCAESIDATYGHRNGPAASSVNGTAVLGQLFEQRGHQVITWRSLSPKLEKCQTVVWFPDDFSPPSDEVVAWLQGWLARQPGRTLVYVGRDFDAAPRYWDHVKSKVPRRLAAETRRRLLDAQSEFQADRSAFSGALACPWFTLDADGPWSRASTLEGDPRWLAGVDPVQVEIEWGHRLRPPAWAQVLVSSQGEPVVSRLTVGDGQVLLVANGSWLLNLPLVNHQHRHLAQRLVEQAGAPGVVVFLESKHRGPPLYTSDPSEQSLGLGMFGVWPINAVFIHLVALAVVFGLCRFPIFGLPRETLPALTSDFGQHIEAVGRLLEWTGDETYATERWRHYLAGARSSDRRGLPPAETNAAIILPSGERQGSPFATQPADKTP